MKPSTNLALTPQKNKFIKGKRHKCLPERGEVQDKITQANIHNKIKYHPHNDQCLESRILHASKMRKIAKLHKIFKRLAS